MQCHEARIRRERRFSNGAGCLLVVVDGAGAYWDRMIVEETILLALEHFGMPYRVLDLARERPTAERLATCAGVVLAQSRLGQALTEAETEVLADAVRQGAGLVNLDNDLRLYHGPLLEMFGFEGVNPNAYATDVVRVRSAAHSITQMQTQGELHHFDRMATAVIAESWGADVVPLVDGLLGKEQLVYTRHLSPGCVFEPGHFPVLFATRWGKGRAVQFALNPRVWRNAVFGHARGMDDLFWRSLVWSVRKPFAANMVPPFVTMSIDDCCGRLDFGYVDLACDHGFVPMPSLFLRHVPERLFPKIREGVESGRAQYNTHALSYYELMTYDFGRGECARGELERRFAYDDAWWGRVGASPAATNRFHWGEYGRFALPFLKQRGRVFFCPALQTGLHKADMCMLDGYWPFNLQNRYYDYLPDDPDFFAFAAVFPRGQEDFLTNCTAWLGESERNDVERAASSAADRIRFGLRDGFFGELVFHEQKLDALTLEEWDRILTRTEELTAPFEKIHAGHDEIARCLKAKSDTWISESVVEGDEVCAKLAGQADAPLRLSIFRDQDDAFVREYRTVTPGGA